MTISKTSLHPYPNGWYLYGFSDELGRGKILSLPFMGQEIIVYRTESGQPVAMGAYCAHLGAHFGFGGTVEGELLRCPFHGFCYDTEGRCISTGYGTKPPPKATLRKWTLQEQNGLLLIYYHGNADLPQWKIPALDDTDWTPLLHHRFILFDHPQETTENSVDLGHFAFVHKYRNVRALGEPVIEGPYMSTAYAVSRRLSSIEKLFTNIQFEFQFETHIYGLGYSQVNVTIPGIGARLRLWVLPTPIDEERITLNLATSAKYLEPGRIHPLLSWIPKKLLTEIVRRFTFAGFLNDVKQDIPIWQNKQYVSPPALAEGDGPIGPYRQWAKQFYSEGS